MQALRLLAWGEEPELVDVPVPEPGPGELLLRVDAAGLCHSDLHVMDSGGSLPYTLPFTLGHEVAGTVDAVGAGVSPDWLDERGRRPRRLVLRRAAAGAGRAARTPAFGSPVRSAPASGTTGGWPSSCWSRPNGSW